MSKCFDDEVCAVLVALAVDDDVSAVHVVFFASADVVGPVGLVALIAAVAIPLASNAVAYAVVLQTVSARS